MIKFTPGLIPEFTNLEFTDPSIGERFFHKANDDGYFIHEFRFGPRSIYAALVAIPCEKRCFIEIANTPEGDERLDGASKEWSSARSTLWIDMVPVVRAVMQGELP